MDSEETDLIAKYADKVSCYSFRVDDYDRDIEVSLTGHSGDTWAIRDQFGRRLSRTRRFDDEPSNSSKTPTFIERHTFTLAEALPIAEEVAAKRRARNEDIRSRAASIVGRA